MWQIHIIPQWCDVLFIDYLIVVHFWTCAGTKMTMKSTGRIPIHILSHPRMTLSRVCTSARGYALKDPSTQNTAIHWRLGTFVSLSQFYTQDLGCFISESLFLTEMCSFEEAGAPRHLWLHRFRNCCHHPRMHHSQSLPKTRFLFLIKILGFHDFANVGFFFLRSSVYNF